MAEGDFVTGLVLCKMEDGCYAKILLLWCRLMPMAGGGDVIESHLHCTGPVEKPITFEILKNKSKNV